VLRPAAWVAAATARTAVFAVAASHGGAAAGAMLAAALREASPDAGDVAALLSARVRGGGGESGAVTPRARAPRRLVVEVPLLPCGSAYADADAAAAEADADADALRALRPHLALIPNLRRGCASELRAAAALARRMRPGGALLLCGDDAAGVNALAAALAAPQAQADADADADAHEAHAEEEEEAPAARAVVTFGLAPGNDWRAVCAAPNAAGGTSFTVVRAGVPLARVELRQPGEAAVRAALGAVAAAALLAAAAPAAAPGGGLDMLTAAAGGAAWRHAAAADGGGGGSEAAAAADSAAAAAASGAAAALRRFPGVARSLQRVGACRRARPRRGVIVYDDASCDAAGVEDALASAAQRHDGSPLWVVFAPHAAAGADADALAGAFQGAARVVVVAPPGADAAGTTTNNAAAAALASAIVGPPAVHGACLDDVAARLAFELAHADAACAADDAADDAPPPVVVITMGAPGVAPLGAALLARLRGGGGAMAAAPAAH
jgi:hypothetical protein